MYQASSIQAYLEVNKIFYSLKYLNLLNNDIDDSDKGKFIKKYKAKNPNVELYI